MARTLDSIPDRGKDKKWEDDLKLIELPNGEYVTVRIVGSVLPYAKHWIEFISQKTGKRSTFPVDCPRFNPDTEEFDRPLLDPKSKKPLEDKKGNVRLVPCACCDAGIKASVSCLLWVIDYRLVEDGNSNPIRALRLPIGVVRDIKQMKQLNKVKNDDGKLEPTSVMHEKHGCQISIKYDDSAKGPNKWSLSKGERLPLTKDERKLIKSLRDFEEIIQFPEQGKVIADLKRHKYLHEDGSINEDRESLDPRDQERGGKDKGDSDRRGSKPKGKRASVSSEEEDGSEEESEPKAKSKKGKKPTDSEDEPAPKKKSKKSSSEEDSEADSEDSEEKPSKGKKGKKVSSEEDSEADSEDDSEKPAKSKKGAVKKGKSSEDSEADEDLDSEDLPDPKKGKVLGKKASAKKGKSSEDSEEASEDEDGSEEDEDSEEKPSKGKKGKKTKSSEDSEKPAKGKGKKKFDSSEDD